MPLEEIYDSCYPIPMKGCMVWLGKSYMEPLINGRSVRQLVWQATRGDIPADYGVVGACSTKNCVAAEHINLEPLRQRVITTKSGTISVPTTRKWNQKDITAAKARSIREDRMNGVPRAAVAEKYRISASMVWFIEAGKSHNEYGSKPDGWYPGCTIKSMKNKPQSSDPGAAAGG